MTTTHKETAECHCLDHASEATKAAADARDAAVRRRHELDAQRETLSATPPAETSFDEVQKRRDAIRRLDYEAAQADVAVYSATLDYLTAAIADCDGEAEAARTALDETTNKVEAGLKALGMDPDYAEESDLVEAAEHRLEGALAHHGALASKKEAAEADLAEARATLEKIAAKLLSA